MIGTLRQNIYALNYPGILIDDVSAPAPDPLAAVRYSCTHWIVHLCEAYALHSSSLSDTAAVLDFLSQHFLYWLEALSLLRNLSHGAVYIARLETLLREQSPESDLFRFVQDARQFILHNQWIIEHAPLQTYSSALIFSPVQSLIRQTFEKEGPRWIVTKPAVKANWSSYLQTLEGHRGPVISLAFSTDSKLVASGSDDNTVKIWDAATGAEVQTLEGHSRSVNSVAFSANFWLMASGSDDNTVRIWDTATGVQVCMLEGHGDSVQSVAFSADSKRVASGSSDNTVKIWDTATGKEVRTLKVSATLRTLSFDATSSYLRTDIGIIRLNATPSDIGAGAQDLAQPQRIVPQGYGLGSDRSWISWHGIDVLWLPPEYRPSVSVVSPSSVAFGTSSGGGTILGFSGTPTYSIG